MAFSYRLSNGWKISKVCFRMLNANKQLLLFPLFSGLSILLVIVSFFWFMNNGAEADSSLISQMNGPAVFALWFLFYVVAYFIVVFFNMALVHCARLYFEGKETSLGKGIGFSLGRIGVIFSWAMFAATIGLVLRILQNNLGLVGRIVTGIAGFVWSIASFFAVPVIAYEDLGPGDALKRSAEMMREKWGESLVASFSFGLFQLICTVVLMLITVFAIQVYEGLGAIVFAVGIAIIAIVSSAMQTILTAAIYCDINGNKIPGIEPESFDDLFEQEQKRRLI